MMNYGKNSFYNKLQDVLRVTIADLPWLIFLSLSFLCLYAHINAAIYIHTHY